MNGIAQGSAGNGKRDNEGAGMMFVYLVTQHDVTYTAPIVHPGTQTNIVATSAERAKEIIIKEYGGEIIAERAENEYQRRVLLTTQPLKASYLLVFTITKVQLY